MPPENVIDSDTIPATNQQVDCIEKALAPWAHQRHFVRWRYGKKRAGSEKPPKIPLDPRTGLPASTNRPETWGTLAEATGAKFLEDSGVGLVLSPELGIVAIDIDGCITADLYSPLAEEVLRHGKATYAEVSPSGAGLRLLVRGVIPRNFKEKSVGLEVYGSCQYVTITGNILEG